jgi:hypothetical protein
MMARDSSLGMVVSRFSRRRGGVGVITMPDGGLDTSRCVEVCLGVGVLRLLVPGVVVGVCTESHSVADGVEVTR